MNLYNIKALRNYQSAFILLFFYYNLNPLLFLGSSADCRKPY